MKCQRVKAQLCPFCGGGNYKSVANENESYCSLFLPNSFTHCWTAFNLLSRVSHLKMENTAMMGVPHDMSQE